MDIQVTPLNKKNQLLGWLITFRDISARKEAKSSLKKSENDYRDLVNKGTFPYVLSDPSIINLDMNVEEIMLDINTAIPLGLIVNELVSNSMKHAFPNGQRRNWNRY